MAQAQTADLHAAKSRQLRDGLIKAALDLFEHYHGSAAFMVPIPNSPLFIVAGDLEQAASLIEGEINAPRCTHCNAKTDDDGYSIDQRCCFHCKGD